MSIDAIRTNNPKQEVAYDTVNDRLERYKAEKPEFIERTRLKFKNPAAAMTTFHNWKDRCDLMEAMVNDLLMQHVGHIELDEKVADQTAKHMIWVIEDLGLQVEADPNEANLVSIFDPKKEGMKPSTDEVLPTQVADVANRWDEAEVVTLNINGPDEAPEYRDMVRLRASMIDSLKIEESEEPTPEYDATRILYEAFGELMCASNGNTDDTGANYLLPYDEEMQKVIQKGHRIKRDDPSQKDLIQELNPLIHKSWTEAQTCGVVNHGFAGNENIQLEYGKIIGNIIRADPKAVLILTSVMGSKGTLARIDGRKPTEINQTDQAKQLMLFAVSQGLGYFTREGRKLLVEGHSMGGEAVLEWSAMIRKQWEDYMAKMSEWRYKGDERGEIKSWKQRRETWTREFGIIQDKYQELKLSDPRNEIGEVKRVYVWLKEQINQAGIAIDLWQRDPGVLNDKPNITVISEEACINRQVSEPLVGRNLLSAGVRTGKKVPQELGPIVDASGLFLMKIKEWRGRLYGGKHLSQVHVKAISDPDTPTAEQFRGIVNSEGPDKETVNRINHSMPLMILAQKDHLLSHKDQVRVAREKEIKAVMLHIPNADHFAFTAKDYQRITEGWYRMGIKLTGQQMEDFCQLLRRAVTRNEEAPIWLIPHGVDPLEININHERYIELLEKSNLKEFLWEQFGNEKDTTIIGEMYQLIEDTLGYISIGSGPLAPKQKDVEISKKLAQQRTRHRVRETPSLGTKGRKPQSIAAD